MQFAAATALNNLFAFIFGDHALHLEEQLIFRRSRNRAIDEGDFDSELFEFFNQHKLMGMLASQPVRSENQNLIDLACSRSITQSIEFRARQRGAADSVVGEDQIRI